ncbi:MAG: polysaccharide biosynthesis C-terminal domain-containing protein [Ginsengibacter sp.]
MPIAKTFYQSVLWKGLFFVSSFVLNIFLARHFQAAISGEIFYLINNYSFVILIASLTMESAMGYYVSTDEISVEKLVNFSVVWSLFIAICLTSFFLSTSSLIEGHANLAISFITGNMLLNFSAGIANAKRNFVLTNVVSIIINVVLILLLLIIDVLKFNIISDNNFIFFFFSSYLLQAIISVIGLISFYVRTWKFTFLSIQDFIKLFSYTLVAFSANLVFFLLYRIDYWFVKYFCSAADLGNYIQVSKIGQLFFLLPGVMASVVFPLTAGGNKKDVKDILAVVSRSIFVLYFAICLCLIVIGYWLFPFLFGDSFSKMYLAFIFLVPGILALSTLYTLTAYYAGKNRINVNIKGAFISLVIMIAADLIVIPRYGIYGAAAVSSISYIIFHVYVLNVFRKEYKVSPAVFFNFRRSDFSRIKNSVYNRVKNA